MTWIKRGARLGAVAFVASLGASVAMAQPQQASAATCVPDKVVYTATMEPSCGVLWGVAADAFGPTQGPRAHREFERLSGRTMGIYHAYYRGDESFPSAEDVALLHEADHPRMLLANWKVAEGMTWADVAAGRADERIDRWAANVRLTFPDRFFLALHHEPEDDVNLSDGSGMTPADYRDMFRHTVERLRANEVTNAIVVWNVMGFSRWIVKPWFATLYPGDDVVDWVAWDPYLRAAPGTAQGLQDLVDRSSPTPLPGGSTFPGTYDYMLARFGSKPFMLAEFGFQQLAKDGGPEVPVAGRGSRAAFYRQLQRELDTYPNLKAMVYFDTKGNPAHGAKALMTSVNATPESLQAWIRLNEDPRLLNPPASAITAERPPTHLLGDELTLLAQQAERLW